MGNKENKENEANLKYFGNPEEILRRFEFLKEHEQGTVCLRDTPEYQIVVEKNGTQILMYFAQPDGDPLRRFSSGVMSRVDIEEPLNLTSVYTQAMMLSLLWKPEPSMVCVMGFGGGRIPMVLHHYFPRLLIESTEIDPAVLEIAEKYFGIVLDNRMRVHMEDARSFLSNRPSTTKYDIIFLDCFTGMGHHPFELSTEEFYDLCKKHLAQGGVVSSNIIENDTLFHKKMQMFTDSFQHVWRYRNPYGTNVFYGSENDISEEELVNRAKELLYRYDFEFPFIELLVSILRIK